MHYSIISKTQIVLILAVMVLCFAVCDGQSSKLSIKPENPRVTRGSNLVITCSHQTSDFRDVTWYDPAGDILNTNIPNVLTLEQEDTPIGDGTITDNSLTLLSISMDNSGIYTCEATGKNETIVRVTSEVEVYEPIQINNPEKKQSIILNEDGVLKCNVSGNPKPMVTWSKNNTKLDLDNADKYDMIAGTFNLLIRNVSGSDEGTYECKAIEKSGGQLDSTEIHATVVVKPNITVFDDTKIAVEGISFQLFCEATGKPSATYTWYKDFRYNVTGLEPITVGLNEDGTVLTITNVTQKETPGIYTCVASNDAGEDQRHANVRVYVRPEFTEVIGDKVAEGSRAQLKCNADGDPLPTVEFFRYDSPLNNTAKRYSLEYDENTATVLFVQALEEDSGAYMCRATNTAGTTEEMVYLDIKYAPKDTNIKSVFACPNTVARLECQFNANPSPNLTWSDDQGVISPNNVQLANGIAYLQIDTISDETFNTYTCTAQNEIGNNSAEATIFKALVPGSPTKLDTTQVNTKDITFTFAAPFENNVEVMYYTISLTPATNGVEGADTVPANVDSHTITKLKPNTTYTLQLKTVNCMGTSSPSEELTFTTSPIGTPQPVTFMSGKSSTDHDQYTIRWVLNDPAGGSFEKIVMVINKVISAIDGSEDEYEDVDTITLTKDNTEFNDKQYTLTGLESATKYMVTLSAHNEVASSDSTLVFTTNTNYTSSDTANDFIDYSQSNSTTDQSVSYSLSNATNTEGRGVDLAVSQDTKSVEDIAQFKGNASSTTQVNTTKNVILLTTPNAITAFKNEPVLESTTTAVDVDMKVGGSNAMMIGIILAVLLILLIVIDCICCCTRKWGVTMFIYLHTCGKNKAKSKDIEGGADGEKEANEKYSKSHDNEVAKEVVETTDESQLLAENATDHVGNGRQASNLTPISEIPVNDETAPLKGEEKSSEATNCNQKESTDDNNKNATTAAEEEKSLIENANNKTDDENNPTTTA